MPSDNTAFIIIPAGASPIRPDEKKVILGKVLNELQVEILKIKQMLMEINKWKLIIS